MEVEILETRDFPSSESNRVGQLETHVFARIDGADVVSINLGRRVSDPKQIIQLSIEQLKLKQSLRGQKFSV